MIFTETREGRRFIGEFDPGMPVKASLHQIAAQYRIATGWIRGSGFMHDPIIRAPLEDGGFGEPEAHPGRHMVGSLDAIISEKGGETDIVVRVLLQGQDGEVVSGILEEGISASIELLCHTCDDITLRRYHDDSAGFARWLDVAVNVAEAVPEVVKSGRVAMEAMPSRLLEPNEMPTLKVGDWLEHPRLGQCEVVQVVDDDRVSIKMNSGKVAQLHLGLLTLTRATRRRGRTVYDVQIRRRNR